MRSVCDEREGRAAAGREAGGRAAARSVRGATEYDLRRRDGLARAAEVLLRRADLLAAEDAALVRSILGRGMTITELAAAAGRRPHTLSSRLRRLIARVSDPAFGFVVGHRDAWPRPMRAVATACILQGRTVREAAEDLRMSVAVVRRHRDAALALASAITPPRSPGTGEAA